MYSNQSDEKHKNKCKENRVIFEKDEKIFSRYGSAGDALKFRASWLYKWASPGRINDGRNFKIREVVRGPFLKPKILKTLPTVMMASSLSGIPKKSTCCTNIKHIRRGIPDPWAECLILKGLGEKDKLLLQNYCLQCCWRLPITDTLWNNLGLSFVQGIPDPWIDSAIATKSKRSTAANKKKLTNKSSKDASTLTRRKKITDYKCDLNENSCDTKTSQKLVKTCCKYCTCKMDNEHKKERSPTAVKKFLSCMCDLKDKNAVFHEKLNTVKKKVKVQIKKHSSMFFSKPKKPSNVNRFYRNKKLRGNVKNSLKYSSQTKLVCCKCKCPYLKVAHSIINKPDPLTCYCTYKYSKRNLKVHRKVANKGEISKGRESDGRKSFISEGNQSGKQGSDSGEFGDVSSEIVNRIFNYNDPYDSISITSTTFIQRLNANNKSMPRNSTEY